MEELVKEILADGKIDAEEVQKLREAIYADEEVDEDEARALFELNNKAEEKCPEFKEFFVEAIKNFILEDGTVDEWEEKFLLEQISADGEVDENEKALLQAIAAETDLPESLMSLIN